MINLIRVIEKDLLEDNFIIKPFAKNISLNESIYFSKNDIYYFGNYKKEALIKIKNKILKNKKRIIKAIENNIRFIVYGNSTEIFNNTFNHNDVNLFTCYNPYEFKKHINRFRLNKKHKDNKIKRVDNINDVITSENFLYKNFLCVKNKKIIEKNFL